MTITLQKPQKRCVTVAQGLAWRSSLYQVSRKYDGCFETRAIQVGGISAVLAVERMKFKAGGMFTASDRSNFDRFGVWDAAWDVLDIGGLDLRNAPLRVRWAQLCAMAPLFKTLPGLLLAESGPGGDFVGACLAAGAEGACAKDWNSPWGEIMLACKPLQTFLCVVTGFVGGGQSVTMARTHGGNFDRGEFCGGIALRGGKIERVRIGSIIKVECLGTTPNGMLREARPCSDTASSWLVKY